MRKILVSFLVYETLLVPLNAFAFNKVFEFKVTDFEIENNDDIMYISSLTLNCTYDYNLPGDPNLPYCQFALPGDKVCDKTSLRYEVLQKRLIASDIEMATCLAYAPNESDVQHEDSSKSLVGSYPVELIYIYNGPEYYDDNVLISISPFQYDADNKRLYFIEKLSVSFSELDLNRSASDFTTIFEEDSFDYLIITHDSLINNYKALMDWKTAKGVLTRIVSLDSIQSWCGSTHSSINPFQVKSFINYCYRNHGIKKVLLGGSSSIVPAQTCLLQYNIHEGNSVFGAGVSDYYYSCLNGSLDWDDNRNGIIGEIQGDGVNLTPSVSVSRLPIDNKKQLTDYINKVLRYERNPSNRDYESSMLLCGSKAHWDRNGLSDAQIESEILYDELFQEGYQHFQKYAFYDTGNNLNRSQSDSLINANNIVDVINTYKPHFLNMYSHGCDTCWQYTDSTSFSNVDVHLLENQNAPMVVATVACNTANFDGPYTSLAESLLLQPGGGAIAYWGSSNAGWGSDAYNSHLSPSINMCADFWSSLPDVHDFGLAVKETKKKHLSTVYSGTTPYNWLLKSMNALGDCDLTIYTENPQPFNDIKIRIAPDAVFFEDYADIDSCVVVVSSIDDAGDTFYLVSYSKPYEVDCSAGIARSICLTQFNFIPLYIKTGHFIYDNQNYYLNLQNITFQTGIVEYGSVKDITIGRCVDNFDAVEDVVVDAGAKVSFFPDSQTKIQSGFRCRKGGQLTIGVAN